MKLLRILIILIFGFLMVCGKFKEEKYYQMLRKELELLKYAAKQAEFIHKRAEFIHQQNLQMIDMYKKMSEWAKVIHQQDLKLLEKGNIIHQQDLELIRIQGLLAAELIAKYVQVKAIPSVNAEIVLSKLSNNSRNNVSLFDYLFREGKTLAV